MKNMLIAFLVVMNIGWATIMFAQVAFADRDRERARDTFEYIGNAGNCRVYHKRHNNYVVFVTWGTNCAVSAT